MADEILRTDRLTLHYGGSQILNGIDMTARRGEITCVMGTNGVGKTSLLKAVSGTHRFSGGSLSLCGEEISATTAHAMAQKGVAYVPQGRDIFPLLTVRENMETAFACLPKSEHFIPDHIYELFYMAELLSKQPRSRGPNLTIITNAGGPGVLATDALLGSGGELSPLSDEVVEALETGLRITPVIDVSTAEADRET